jgi:hypothetical protein
LKTCPKLQKHRGSQMLESQMGLGCLGVKAIIKTIWLGASRGQGRSKPSILSVYRLESSSQW